jgi:integrase
MNANQPGIRSCVPWNKGKLVGQKAPFKPKDIWTMRLQLQLHHRTRELAMLDLGIDCKLRACDLVALKVRDISHGDQIAPRANIQQKKTDRPVQFEITPVTRQALQASIREAGLGPRGSASARRSAITASARTHRSLIRLARVVPGKDACRSSLTGSSRLRRARPALKVINPLDELLSHP